MRPRTLTTGELAWVAVVPCAIVVCAAIIVVGPWLGKTLFHPLNVHFWPTQGDIRPEPTEHARYLLAVLGAVLPSAIVFAGASRVRLPDASIKPIARASRALALAVLPLSILAQRHINYTEVFTGVTEPVMRWMYFTWPTIAVAGTLALMLAGAASSERVRAGARAVGRETRARRAACLALAVVFTADWLLLGINSDGTIGLAHEVSIGFVPWTLNESFAVLNGASPLVDFHSQYGSLFPYLGAAVMSLLGPTLAVLTSTMELATGLSLLAIYAILRRVTRSSTAALLLYLPFVATSFFKLLGPMDNRYAPMHLYSLFPVRTAGPFLLAWLTVRHLDGARPRRPWPLFLVAGLAILNNVEFGIAALAATIAALMWSGRVSSLRAGARLLRDAVGGLLGAFVLVSALTLIRTGQLPHLGLLVEFSRLYGLGGWGMLPMPTFGFHEAMLLTYVAAVVTATVRAVGRQRNDSLTGMLAFSGIFGFGASGYYVGNSHYLNLILVFSPWALALALLVVAVVQGMLERPTHRPTFADLAVLAAFGLAVCSLAQTPTPWSQISRLGRVADAQAWRDNATERFVAADTRPGEHVAIMFHLGHRIAYDRGLVNVSPYSSMEATPTREQLNRVVARLRRAHGDKLFYQITRSDPGEELKRLGFRLKRMDQARGYSEWVDSSAAHRG